MQYYMPSIPAIECPPLVPDDTPVLVCPSCGDGNPDDPKTWSAFGTAYLRLPFLQRGRYKMKFTSTRHETASLWRAA
jgi:hypothetical protein